MRNDNLIFIDPYTIAIKVPDGSLMLIKFEFTARATNAYLDLTRATITHSPKENPHVN